MPDDSVVHYSVKELIERLDRKIDTFMQLLHGKADSAEVAALHVRMDTMQQDLTALQQREAAQEQHDAKSTEWKRWAIGTGAAFALVGVTAASVLLTSH